MAPRAGSRKQGKKDQPQMSIQVILARRGLEPYFPYFDKAGYRFLDSGAQRLNDTEVERMIIHVEGTCGVAFLPDVRTMLWKAIRFQWFSGPGHETAFIAKSDVPKIFLPKLDFKQVDSMITFGELESDRQRQVIRRVRKKNQVSIKGPTLETLQFEVYKRDTHLIYEFRDIQKCVIEWQKKNPRTMMRADPREEVLKIRIFTMMEHASAILIHRREQKKSKKTISRLLAFIRAASLFMCVTMVYIAYSRYSHTPSALQLDFIVSSHQFRSAIAYLISFWFSHIVCSRGRGDSLISSLRRMLVSLERLEEQISDFRVESEKYRLADAEAKQDEMQFAAMEAARAEKQSNVATAQQLFERKAKKKAKKESEGADPLKGWCGDELKKNKGKVDFAEMNRMIDDSKKRLPELPSSFKRNGGERGSGVTKDGDQRSFVSSSQHNEMCIIAGPVNKQKLYGLEEESPDMPLLGDLDKSGRSRTISRDGLALPAGSPLGSRTGSRLSDPGRTGSRDPGRVGSRDPASALVPSSRVGSRDPSRLPADQVDGRKVSRVMIDDAPEIMPIIDDAAEIPIPEGGEEDDWNPKPKPKRNTGRRASRDPGCMPLPPPPEESTGGRLGSRDSGLSDSADPSAMSERKGSIKRSGSKEERKGSRMVRIQDEVDDEGGPRSPISPAPSALRGTRLGSRDSRGFSDDGGVQLPDMPAATGSLDRVPLLPEMEPPPGDYSNAVGDADRLRDTAAGDGAAPSVPRAAPPDGIGEPALPGSM